MISAAAILWAMASCGQEGRPSVGDRTALTPVMSTSQVKTFISDSGYTRYSLTSQTWDVYDSGDSAYWRFPCPFYLEQYDRDMRVAATMRCDSARYMSVRKIWHFYGNVVMVNTLADSFLTQYLTWNQASRTVSTDSFVHIVRQDRILEGYGLNANEDMTEYTLLRPSGLFPQPQPKPAQQETPDQP